MTTPEGCLNRRCDGHHLRHWAEGGPTTLDNTCLLCDRHHTLVHEGGWTLQRRPDGSLRFLRPDGTELEPGQPGARLGAAPVDELRAIQAHLGITATTGIPTWDGTPVDYDWGARALWRQVGSPAP